ncbi:MAG: tetratricopeptide repeat protein [Bacteroidales bacterium]|nr:tetratricopeptide repeat protein [Bacteroidales bacterium]
MKRGKNYILISLALIYITACSQSSDVKRDVDDSYQSLAKSLTEEQLKQIDKQELAKGNGDSTFFRGKATVYFWRKEYDLAINEIDKELEKNPTNSDALHLKGSCLSKNGKQQDAIEYINKAIEIKDTISTYYYNRALAHDRMGNILKAIPDYEKAHELKPTDEKAINNLGMCYFDLEMFDKSEEVFRKIVYTNRNNLFANKNLALSCLRQNKLEEAEKYYKIANDIEPNNSEILYTIGIICAKQEKDEACDWFKAAEKSGFQLPNEVKQICE